MIKRMLLVGCLQQRVRKMRFGNAKDAKSYKGF